MASYREENPGSPPPSLPPSAHVSLSRKGMPGPRGRGAGASPRF